jgi:hypothetical protein
VHACYSFMLPLLIFQLLCDYLYGMKFISAVIKFNNLLV